MKCAGCGADLSAEAGERPIICGYCGAESALEWPFEESLEVLRLQGELERDWRSGRHSDECRGSGG